MVPSTIFAQCSAAPCTKPRPRTVLQGPMNPLAPPLDSVFDREVKCVREGVGFKQGSTVNAYCSEVPVFGRSLAEVQSLSRRKAVIIKVRKKSLQVKFKHDSDIRRIPKIWAELKSSKKLQARSPGEQLSNCALATNEVAWTDCNGELLQQIMPWQMAGQTGRLCSIT